MWLMGVMDLRFFYGDYAMVRGYVDHAMGDDYIQVHLDCIVVKRLI